MSRPDYFDLFSQIQTKNSQIAQEDNESARNALIAQRDALEAQAYVFNDSLSTFEQSFFAYVRPSTAEESTIRYSEFLDYLGDTRSFTDNPDELPSAPLPYIGGSPLYDKTGKIILDSAGNVLTQENITFSTSNINTKLTSIL